MKAEKKNPVGRPPSGKKPCRAAEIGTKPGEMRKTYLVNIDQADKIDAIAYWDRVSVKDTVGEAFEDRIKKFERKNGPLKLKPKK